MEIGRQKKEAGSRKTKENEKRINKWEKMGSKKELNITNELQTKLPTSDFGLKNEQKLRTSDPIAIGFGLPAKIRI